MSEYIPFGDEWKAETKRVRKSVLIEMLADVGKENARLQAVEQAAREAALMAFERAWIFHVDIDGPTEEHKATFLDRYDKELAAVLNQTKGK